MLTRLPVHLFSGEFPPAPGSGGRWRTPARQAADGLTGLLWLPAAIAAIGSAVYEAALPAGVAGWLYLAAGGLPLGLAWFLLGTARRFAMRMAFAVLVPLGILGCVLAAGAGAPAQGVVAAVIGLPIWILFLVQRHGRRNAVRVENTVWRVGTMTW